MTLYESIQIVNNKIIVMHNKLYTLLNKYNIDISQNNTFTELIEKVDTIPGAQYFYRDNIKPTSNIIFNINDSLLRKEINIYYKIQYLSDYLRYALAVKGVPRRLINECESLNELIDLVNLIDKVKAPTLTINVEQADYYYNSYINLPYTLVDENDNPITDGYIIVLENNIEIASIRVGEDLKFLPSDIGTYNYTIYYAGTDEILPTEQQDYTFNILPPTLILSIEGKNVGNSQYKYNEHIFYDEDTFEVKVITTNPYIDARLVNIPFSITVPQSNGGNQYYYGVTDLNGECTINIQSNKIDTFDITVKTNNDNKKITNAVGTYNVTVYSNPIKIKNYVFLLTDSDKKMEINCYNNQGILVNDYYTSAYKIIQKYNEENYRNYNLANKSNPFIIDETHNEIGKYNYTYELYKNDKIICTTTNNVRIKREVNIELIPVNKFLTQNTENIQVYIYVSDHLDNPIPNTSLRLIDTYHGLRDGVYTTNSQGMVITTINVKDILTAPCNGFLLQAVVLEKDNQDICQVVCDDYSNAVYYRINNDNILDTNIEIKTLDTYSLTQLSFDVILTIYDSEGERVLRPISNLNIKPSTSIQTSNAINVIDGSFAHIDLDNTTYEGLIGDTLILKATYDGENNHYNNTNTTKNITFIKSDVVISTTLPSFTVYDASDISLTLTIPNVSSKYITGDVEIVIDDNIYPTERSNNMYTTSITPMDAKQTQLYIYYNGNKYTNTNTINYPINIDKTNKYNLECALSDEEIYIEESIIFTPELIGTTAVEQSFNGTITYSFSNGTNYTKDLNPFSYTPPKAGQYDVTITYNGDKNHYSKTITKNFTVLKRNPTLSLIVPEISAMYRDDIDYKVSEIGYSGNDESLTVRVYDNNIEKYNQSSKEYDENIFNITTAGQHTIKLTTDETEIYNSLTLEKIIETYDFLEETYKILNNENDNYSIEEKIEQILDCILGNEDNYDEDVLEGLYKILEHLED